MIEEIRIYLIIFISLSIVVVSVNFFFKKYTKANKKTTQHKAKEAPIIDKPKNNQKQFQCYLLVKSKDNNYFKYSELTKIIIDYGFKLNNDSVFALNNTNNSKIIISNNINPGTFHNHNDDSEIKGLYVFFLTRVDKNLELDLHNYFNLTLTIASQLNAQVNTANNILVNRNNVENYTQEYIATYG